MGSLLIADSGSTKTDWCLLRSGGRSLRFKTSGINPYLQSEQQIHTLLETELGWDRKKHLVDGVVFYGAGAGNAEQQQKVSRILKKHFETKKVEVKCDLIAASRALCGSRKGIVCILGTGSNSCYFDGRKIRERQVSLGYIAGDEGSGNYMGKRILQYYAYHTFDDELTMAFEMKFGSDIGSIVKQLYAEPFPNRYLASFVALLKENRGHFMIENIIEDCLNDFFHFQILKYRQSWKYPLFFTGSVAHEFADVIKTLCEQYELECGDIKKSPLESLIKFHSTEL